MNNIYILLNLNLTHLSILSSFLVNSKSCIFDNSVSKVIKCILTNFCWTKVHDIRAIAVYCWKIMNTSIRGPGFTLYVSLSSTRAVNLSRSRRENENQLNVYPQTERHVYEFTRNCRQNIASIRALRSQINVVFSLTVNRSCLTSFCIQQLYLIIHYLRRLTTYNILYTE